MESTTFEMVNSDNKLLGRRSVNPQPETYPKTTEIGWNNDVISLVSSPSFLAMARKGGLNVEFWNSVADIGVGAIPMTTVEMMDNLRSRNKNLKFTGTELTDGLATAHIKISQGPVLEDFKAIAAIHMNDRFRKLSAATGLKSIPWVNVSKIFEVRLVVSQIGADKDAGISEIIVGVKDKGRVWYMTLSVAPQIKYVMKGVAVDSTWKNPGIFEDFIHHYMGADYLKSIIQKSRETSSGEVSFEFAGLRIRKSRGRICSHRKDWPGAGQV
jgi:hypothetical protein